MAQSLISIITLATIVAAVPLERRQEYVPTSVASCAWTYWSVAGDDCNSVALKTQMSVEAIIESNSFLTCDDIWVNTPICVPASPTVTATLITFSAETTFYVPNCAYTYYSAAGDTCDSIGAANGQSGNAIHDANTFLDCSDIWVGTPICVPPASTTISPPAFTPTITTLTGPVTTYIDPTTTIVGLGPITTEVDAPPSQSCFTYIAQAGDTCASIAAIFGVTADDVYEANSFVDCQNIWQYTNICVPIPQPTATITGTFYPVPSCSVTYTSVDGDTCDSIGSKFGVSGNDVYQANTFLSCGDIWPWTPVCIPFPVITDYFNYSKRS